MTHTGINFMRQYDGLRENADRETLMSLFSKYSHDGDISVDPETTPWCAVMMNCTERMAGNDGTGMENARSFLQYGDEIDPKDMQVGDILIFSRGSNNVQGHVTYLEAKQDDPDLVTVIGGNQGSGMVCRETHSLDRLIGVRRS